MMPVMACVLLKVRKTLGAFHEEFLQADDAVSVCVKFGEHLADNLLPHRRMVSSLGGCFLMCHRVVQTVDRLDFRHLEDAVAA